MKLNKVKIVIRGGGDLASGIALRLYRSGFRPVITELAEPRMVRTSVSFGTAVYEGSIVIEGVKGVLINKNKAIPPDCIPVIVDPAGEIMDFYKPLVLVDARMIKKGETYKGKIPYSIGVGPGFTAGVDVDAVVETNRGNDLGRVYLEGRAEEDTGIPGIIAGKGAERVLRAASSGRFERCVLPGEIVKEGQVIARSGFKEIRAPFAGIVRGLITEGLSVSEGEKVGDIDPRPEIDIFKISDKARSIGGGVLEAIFFFLCNSILVTL